MSVSKRVRSPIAQPQGHGEEENFTTESGDELEPIDDVKIISKTIEAIRTGKITLKESVGERVRLHIEGPDKKTLELWVRPVAGK